MLYKIIINSDGLLLISLNGPGKMKMLSYAFKEGTVKRDFALKILGIYLHIEKGDGFVLDGFSIEEDTQEILAFFTRTNLTEEEKLKHVVEQYLNGHMSREQFEQEIIPYRVAEKLSK